MLWILIPCAVAVFLAVIILRAAAFRPPAGAPIEADEVEVDAEAVAGRLAAMVRCKTVSSRDERLTDSGEFERFRKTINELYPNVHRNCEVRRVGESGLLYTFKGKSGAAPVVFMSHYDVVTADEPAWEKPPFGGVIEDGVLWGRGTLDTKGTLCGILEAAERLIAEGFAPENDLYFAFSGDEEIAGETAPAMVEDFHRRGIVPAMVLDEGGAVVADIFPGVKGQCALIGAAEKGLLDLELSAKSNGGHASTPPPHTLVGLLARAVTRIEKKPFKSRLTPSVAAMFDTLGRHSSFFYRLIFANLWCFAPLLDAICRKSGGELNAMMRTTCAFTMMEGSDATNVLPSTAKARANLRLIGGDTVDGAIARMESIVDDSEIKFCALYGMEPSPDSKMSGPGWEALKSAVSRTWRGALVSPYLMFACSDSRHYCRISDHVYRFSAMALSREERALIHGHNERIPIDKLADIVRFYTRLMRLC